MVFTLQGIVPRAFCTVHSYNSLNSQNHHMMQLVPLQLNDLSKFIQLAGDRAGVEPRQGCLESPCSSLFFRSTSVCHVMGFLTRGFGRQIANVQQPEAGLWCLYTTISLALLCITTINANGQRPLPYFKGDGSCTFTLAAFCTRLIQMPPCLYEMVQPTWPHLLRQSVICLGRNRTGLSVFQKIFFKNSKGWVQVGRLFK